MNILHSKKASIIIGTIAVVPSLLISSAGLVYATSNHDDDSQQNDDDDDEKNCSHEDVISHDSISIKNNPDVLKAWKALQKANANLAQSKRTVELAKRNVAKAQKTKTYQDDKIAKQNLVKAQKTKKQAENIVHSSYDAWKETYNDAVNALCNTPTPSPTPTPTPKPTVTPTPPPTPTPTPKPTVTPIPTPTGVSGTFNGIVSKKNPYGPVQVQIIVANGKITGVNALQYPNTSDSKAINGRAIPILIREAIVAQSSNIAAVSGASFTSPAFKESLQSAIVLAKL